MAGSTNKGLANRQPAAHQLAVQSEPESGADGCTVIPTLAELLQVKLPSEGDRQRPSPPRLVASNSSQDLQLSRIVELEIIPRLMLMHSTHPLPDRPRMPALTITSDQVAALASLAAEGAPESAANYVRALLDAGASQEQVFLDLLAPCARLMGEMWEDDQFDFSQVTIGLWRLQRVLHEHGERTARLAKPDAESHRALMAAVPGSQHTFGVVMAAEFFSRAGWDVDCEPKASWAELQDLVTGQWFDMFGLSISVDDSIPMVASAILDIREASANPTLFVMVGGPMAAQEPNLAQFCGADAGSCEATEAVALANGAVSRIVRRA